MSETQQKATAVELKVETLDDSASFLAALVESSEDAVITKNLVGIITSWNPAAERIYGYTAREAIGQPISILAPPERPDEIPQILAKLRRGERIEHFETDRRHKDGRMLQVSLTISPIRDGGGQVIGASAIGRDVTERRRTEEILADQRQLLELIAQSAPLEQVLTRIIQAIEAYWHGEMLASILLLDRDGKHLRHGAAPSLPAAYVEAVDGVAIGPSVGSCGTAAFRREEVIVADIAEDPLWADFRDLALGHGLRACWSTPILSTDREVLGTFALYYRQPRSPSKVDRELIAIFGRTAAIAIERSRAEERLERQTRISEILNRVNASLAGELDHDRLVQIVTDAGTELTGAEFGAFFYNVLRNDGQPAYMLYSLSGVPAGEFEKFPMPRATDLFGPTFRGEEIIRLADVTRDPRYGNNEPYAGMPAGHLPVRSYLAVPVVSRSGTVLGGLFFGHPEVDKFDGAHETIATGIAAQAAIAVDNARLFEQTRRQADKLAEANRRKNDFLGLLAHELRNPLAAIGNALALAAEAGGEKGTLIEEILGIVERQSEHMTHLVDDLFDVSRIGRGMIELERERVDLRTIVEQAVEGISPQLEGRGQRLELELPAEPVPIDGDPVRLRQVVSNLLGNASKYSAQGDRIWLELKCQSQRALLRVRDQGAGIDPAFLPRIFDLFTRDTADGRGSPPGLGIGLTLVRQLVELHGGEVRAKSDGPRQGSEFSVRLPLAASSGVKPVKHVREDATPELPPAVSVPDEDGAGRLRVLLVDDHREAVMALQTLLELWGHQVRVAFDGPAALEVAAELHPEVVLLDIGLPEMDGWEVARRLRRRPELESAILVALTGFGQEADRTRSRDAGFDHHLVKPVNPQKLKSFLQEWATMER